MKPILTLLMLPLLLLLTGCGGEETVRVTVLTTGQDTQLPAAIERWAEQHPGFAVDALPLDDVTSGWDDAAVVWLDLPDSAAFDAAWADSSALSSALMDAADAGHSFFFTGHAARLPHRLGWESRAPGTKHVQVLNDWFFDRKRGLQSLYRHPVLAGGLHKGAYTWDPGEASEVDLLGYFGLDHWPEQGRVVAVGKRYVNLEPDDKLLIEHDLPGGGRSLSLGGWFSLDDGNRLRGNAARFLENSLRYLAGRPVAGETERSYWIPLADSLVRFEPAVRDPLRSTSLDTAALRPSPLDTTAAHRSRSLYSLGGRRATLMGEERGGVSEIWTYPFRPLRELRAGIALGNRTLWLDSLAGPVTVRPEAVIRRYETPLGTLHETVFTALDQPAAAVHYRWDGAVKVDLVITHVAELRWMWPYDSDATGSIQYAERDDLYALELRDPQGSFHALYGANLPPKQRYLAQASILKYNAGEFQSRRSTHNHLQVGALYNLPVDGLLYVVAGSNEDEDEAVAAYRRVHGDPAGVINEQADHVRTLLSSRTRFDTPDDGFDRLFDWNLVGIDRFSIHTPGVGAGLVAGFGTGERGWDGEQEISGRPGYAWYFGRDAVWSAFAVGDYGDFATVRDQLLMLRRYQGIDGKVFHELTASGAVHYDAADSTPLYLILAAHYLRHSGDRRTIRELWPSLNDALAFMSRSDLNRDGWIDNPNVGHGWVEGGRLWGAQTSLYLAGLQARALEDMGYLARQLEEQGVADSLQALAAEQRGRLNTEFWNDSTGFYNFSLLPSGGYESEPTVLAAPTAWLNRLNPAHMDRVLDRLAAPPFSTDWGVRILAATSARYSPTSYHGGSVWPLFTGWTALAEYAYDRPVNGFTHAYQNLHVKRHGSLGYVEEVLRGDSFTPHGVCPHQAWSETNAAHPLLAGMLGWAPSATEEFARLAPAFPAHWDSVRVSNLRVGESRFDLSFERTRTGSRWRFVKTAGPALRIGFLPTLPPGMTVDRAMLNSAELDWRLGVSAIDSSGQDQTRVSPDVKVREQTPEALEFVLKDDAELELITRGGLSLVPLTPRPRPGDRSRGPQLIRQRWVDGSLSVALNGRSGETDTVLVWSANGKAFTAGGDARLLPARRDGLRPVAVHFPAAADELGYSRVELRLIPAP